MKMLLVSESVGTDKGEVVCRCLKVTSSDIHEAVLLHDPKTIRDLGRCTGAGSGCTACHARLAILLEQSQEVYSEGCSPICSAK